MHRSGALVKAYPIQRHLIIVPTALGLPVVIHTAVWLIPIDLPNLYVAAFGEVTRPVLMPALRLDQPMHPRHLKDLWETARGTRWRYFKGSSVSARPRLTITIADGS